MNKDFAWLRQVILSSFTPFHIEGCHALLFLYKQKFPDLKDDYDTLLKELQDKEVQLSPDA